MRRNVGCILVTSSGIKMVQTLACNDAVADGSPWALDPTNSQRPCTLKTRAHLCFLEGCLGGLYPELIQPLVGYAQSREVMPVPFQLRASVDLLLTDCQLISRGI